MNSRSKVPKVASRSFDPRRSAQITRASASRVHTKRNATISIALAAGLNPITGKVTIAANESQKNAKPPKVTNPKRLFIFHSSSPVMSIAKPPQNTAIATIGLVTPIKPALARLSKIVVIPKAQRPSGVGLSFSFTTITFLVESSICVIQSPI